LGTRELDHAPEGERRRNLRGPIDGGVERRVQVAGGLAVARVGLGEAQLQQHAPAQRGLRRLGQRAAQVGDRRVRRALTDGRARGRAQLLDDPRVAGRLGGQQMRGDGVGRGPLLGEEARGAGVAGGAGAGRQLAGHRGVQDRMREGQRTPRPQDPCRRHRVRGGGRFRRLELRERCGVAQLRVGPEDGQCPGRAAGTRPEPVDAHQHGACDGPRAELAHPLGVGGGGVDVLLGEGAHELADEERRAARGLVAGGGEGRLRLYADERGDGVDAQRPRAHQSRAGLGGQVGDHRRCCRTLCAGTRTPSPWRSPSRPRR
jgi:hypothetical protein